MATARKGLGFICTTGVLGFMEEIILEEEAAIGRFPPGETSKAWHVGDDFSPL